MQNARWLAFAGDIGYQLLLKLNTPVHYLRQFFGLGYWSLSAAVKKSVKEAVSFVGAFEQGIVRFAQEDHVEGVVCGHIHSPVIRTIDSVAYYNSGDWVESTSALVEDFDGKIELITNFERTIGKIPPSTSTDSQEDSDSVLATLISRS